jgi:hypothetical protein
MKPCAPKESAMHHRISPLAIALTLALATVAAPAIAQQAMPAPAPQAVLSEDAVALLEEALGGTLHEDLQLESRPYFFPSLQGGTLTMIGFLTSKDGIMFGANEAAGIGPDGMPFETAKLELFGAVLQNGDEVKRIGTEFDLRKDLGTPDQSGVHSFGDTLQPGSYEVVWGIRDTVSGVVGTRRDEFEVPGFGLELTTSTVLVAKSFGAGQGAFGPNMVYPGIRVLTASFDDDLDRVIDLAETPEVSLTYIVVGAQVDPTTQAFNLEMTYRIIDEESGQSISRTPAQALNRTTVAQPIPLSTVTGLEAGKEYHFEITVKDLAADTETRIEVPFQVAG